MNNTYFSKHYLLWLTYRQLQKLTGSNLTAAVLILISIFIISLSSLYLANNLKNVKSTNTASGHYFGTKVDFMKDFAKISNENELIHNILKTYDHIDIKKLSNTNNYQYSPKDLYNKTEVSLYFDVFAADAQKIAATILDISPLIVLDSVSFSRITNRIDSNPIINVKMDLTLITNRSLKV
ncbi:hypothetical protein [Candidatus Ichthyocystis sparus]|uniref:hypothetical protein n=1 Tax=Candidatus Ichthyocystis sparus TaxID=1561004 RepID=UPI000B8724F1|nr:hypothetical protein [Candidatus Ichthyocystis sparus]